MCSTKDDEIKDEKSVDIHINKKDNIFNNLVKIDFVSCGNNFSACLSKNGDIYSFGKSIYGALGLGIDIYKSFSPKKILGISNATIISCGSNHVICKTLTARKSVLNVLSFEEKYYCWGNMSNNRAGIPLQYSFLSLHEPFECTGYYPKHIKHIECGEFHSTFLLYSGDVYICDINRNHIGDDDNNSLYFFYKPQITYKINKLSNIINIFCGKYYNICVDSNGLINFTTNSALYTNNKIININIVDLLLCNINCYNSYTPIIYHHNDYYFYYDSHDYKIKNIDILNDKSNLIEDNILKNEIDSINILCRDKEFIISCESLKNPISINLY